MRTNSPFSPGDTVQACSEYNRCVCCFVLLVIEAREVYLMDGRCKSVGRQICVWIRERVVERTLTANPFGTRPLAKRCKRAVFAPHNSLQLQDFHLLTIYVSVINKSLFARNHVALASTNPVSYLSSTARTALRCHDVQTSINHEYEVVE